MFSIKRGFVGLAAALCCFGLVMAQPVPQMIKIQGFLTDDLGAPVDGAVTMTFYLYDSPVVGSLITSIGPIAVLVTDGVYEADLTFTSAHFAGRDRFLEHVINGEVLTPRSRVASAPYAFHAEDGNGLSCWDLNENRICDLPAEDTNGDSVCDALDCRGPEGAPGIQGPQGPQGPPGVSGWNWYGCTDYNCASGNTCWAEFFCDLPNEVVFSHGLNLPNASITQRSRVVLNRHGPMADDRWIVEATNVLFRWCSACVIPGAGASASAGSSESMGKFEVGSAPTR
jgi:hypothetical protein